MSADSQTGPIIGVSSSTVDDLVAAGHLVTRKAPRPVPSVSKASADAYAVVRAQEQAERAERAARRRPKGAPPDDEQVWLDTATAALVLGITANRVRQLADRGSLPSELRGHRRWYRRADIETAAAARALRGQYHRTPAGRMG